MPKVKSAKPKTGNTSQAIQVKVEGQQRFFQAERAGNIFEGGSPGFFTSTSGNAVQSKPFFTKPFIQTKLTIGQPGDKYEREADAMADQVVQKEAADGPRPIEQSMCSECAQEEDGNAPNLQRNEIIETNEEPMQQMVQRKCETCGLQASSDLEGRLNATRGGGSPLPEETSASMASAFGMDFSGVRVHTNADAVRMNRELGAQAFTRGSDIYFNAGTYSPGNTEGQRLLGHELTHVVQQGGIEKPDISRSLLDVPEIVSDINDGLNTPRALFSWLHVLGNRSGDVGFAADSPTGSGPDNPVPTARNLPIEAHFFPSFTRHTAQKALIIGGFHGDEQPGYEMVDGLVNELRNGTGPANTELAFHTLIIPRLNRGAIEDHLSGVTSYDRRCNRQLVDLNRNLPVFGNNRSSPRCPNSATAPVQPENQAVIDLINIFQPNRILSTHAISNPRSAGVFADPNFDPDSRRLACSMAGLVVDPNDRPANRISSTQCNPVYPGDRLGSLPAEASLGAYAPSRSAPGQTVPVITIEAPAYRSLSTSGTSRSVEGFLRPIRGFLISPADLQGRLDQDIVQDIQAFSAANRLLFLTGRLPIVNDIYRRIRERIDAKVAELNALGPPTPLRIISQQRAFSDSVGGASPQAEIVFEKFFLTGSRRNGWDSLPDRYFLDAGRRRVDRQRWLAESSATRLDIILQFSAVPGASRHHWGTEVDFNSTTPDQWSSTGGPGGNPGTLHALGNWLHANAAGVGFIQTYTPGRAGGHHEEAWHFSYAPISRPLLGIYNREVTLSQNIISPIMTDWQQRANRINVQLPSDLQSALLSLNLNSYVRDINPALL